MSKKEICELKNIRKELVEDISKDIESHEVMHNTSDLFKMLGNCTRMRIISALAHEELCVCELSLLLDISQSSISHQLRHLRSSNIVKYRKENKQIFYSLIDERISKIIDDGVKYLK